MEMAERKQERKPIRFGEFFFSTRPNGYIGCLEYIVLSIIGWAAAGILSFILMIIWGGGLFTAAAPMVASEHYSSIGAVFSVIFTIICGLCAIVTTLVFWFYHARLVQLRMIDIGLSSNMSVPGIASNFWAWFLAVLIISPSFIIPLILSVFCCVCQGKTNRDNRDLFMPIEPVPPAEELARQMHERSEAER